MKSAKLQLKVQNYLIPVTLFLLPVYLVKVRLDPLSFNLLELLIIVLFFVWAFSKDTKYQIPNTRYFIPVALIFIGLILSVLANKNYYTGFGVIKGWFLFPAIFSAIFYNRLNERDGLLKKSLCALFFSGAAVSLIGVAYKITGMVTYDGRLKIFWDSPNQLAMFLAPVFLIGAVGLIGMRDRAGGWKVFAGILALLPIAYNIYLTQSFGAWLGTIISIGVIVWLECGRVWRKKYLAILLVILLAFLGFVGIGKFENVKKLGDRSSLASRMMIWQSSVLMLKNNPLLGIGPGNFQPKYLEYQRHFPPYLEWSVPQPHNLYLAFWLESGLLGLAGFIWLLYIFFRDNKNAIRNNRDLGTLFLAMVVCILVHGLVDTTYWRNDLAVIFWIVVSANLYLSGKATQTDSRITF